jgi:hypothetical protein
MHVAICDAKRILINVLADVLILGMSSQHTASKEYGSKYGASRMLYWISLLKSSGESTEEGEFGIL